MLWESLFISTSAITLTTESAAAAPMATKVTAVTAFRLALSATKTLPAFFHF